VASQPGSKALLDEDHPASLGTYSGAATRSDEAREAIDNASLLVMAGTVESDFTTGSFTHRYDSALAVELAVDHARIGPAVYPGVRLEDSLQVLHELVSKSQFADASGVALTAPPSVPGGNVDEPLNHERFWARVQDWLAAQLTVQELGTFYARGIRPVVFVLNNDGYTVERLLQSPNADYQDIVAWNWTELPAALGGTDVRTAKVRTVRELQDALQGASDPEDAWLIEAILPRMDVPHRLLGLARGKRATNSTASED
jgi:TPP-dependent 2-oxoacid decarboxylase